MQWNFFRSNQGLTLVELCVYLGITSLLAMFAMQTLTYTTKSEKRATINFEVAEVAALIREKVDCGKMPNRACTPGTAWLLVDSKFNQLATSRGVTYRRGNFNIVVRSSCIECSNPPAPNEPYEAPFCNSALPAHYPFLEYIIYDNKGAALKDPVTSLPIGWRNLFPVVPMFCKPKI